MQFASADDLWFRVGSEALKPPRQAAVADGAAEALVINQPGGYSGHWSAETTPYMVEPMNTLASRERDTVCFVGPSRTGKTLALLDAWMAYAVTCDPGDMLMVQMSQVKAREYSRTRIDRAIRYSDALREKMSGRGHDDNTHDKLFINGMWLKIGWPSGSELSSSDYRYTAGTDYDRWDDDIDGEGSGYTMLLKRTQTFGRRGMCLVESSPGREITDPNWRPATPHEAPPCSGILGIYNRSDRRRWYWCCPHCGEWFEAKPGLSLFATLPPEQDLLELVRKENLPKFAAHHARVVCPACSAIIEHAQKYQLNRGGMWLADGQCIERGRVEGEAQKSSIAGYWLGGVAAAYQTWESLIERYLQGLREFVLTGSEETLKAAVNTDQGIPFMSRSVQNTDQQRPSDRTEPLPRYIVPAAARFLVATVDVQGGQRGRFVVQVHAIGPGMEGWIVDRFQITDSPRGTKDAPVQIDPAGYPEDWNALTDRVVNATYRTGTERELRVLLTVVDSGGEAGATANAYGWYRTLRHAGLASRVMLVKGAAEKPEAPVKMASARDARNQPMRDVKLHLLDTNFFKDAVAAALKRTVPGPGFMHFPDWLPESFFEELAAERRDAKGRWHKVRARNESLDLWVYMLAGLWSLKAHKIDWAAPPRWAQPLETNSESMAPEVRREMKAAPARADSDADLFTPIAL